MAGSNEGGSDTILIKQYNILLLEGQVTPETTYVSGIWMIIKHGDTRSFGRFCIILHQHMN